MKCKNWEHIQDLEENEMKFILNKLNPSPNQNNIYFIF